MGVKLLYIFFLLPLFSSQGPIGSQTDSTNQILYRCPPCGCDHDHLFFHEAGTCPQCNMALVKVPMGVVRKVDKGVAPYFATGMLGQLYTKLIYPIFSIGILLSLFLLLKGIKGRSLNVFLTLIILVLSLYGFKNQLFAVKYSLTNSYKSLFTPISFILWLGPFIFFYVKSLTMSPFKWKMKYWIHFLPGTVMFLYYAVLFITPASIKLRFMHSPFEVRFSHWEQGLAILIGAVYLFSTHRLFVKWMKINFIKDKKMVRWIYRFHVGFFILFVCWGLQIFINYWIYDFGVATVSYNPLWLVMGMLLLWLGIEIVADIKYFLLSKNLLSSNGNHPYSAEEVKRFKSKLDTLMESTKMYIDPSLSLENLASALQIHPKSLSAVLNNGLGKSFYEYVNEFRIEEVKERLADGSSRNFTIESIANQSGFRSKSSFNTAFRKHVSMTPREYMKQALKE